MSNIVGGHDEEEAEDQLESRANSRVRRPAQPADPAVPVEPIKKPDEAQSAIRPWLPPPDEAPARRSPPPPVAAPATPRVAASSTRQLQDDAPVRVQPRSRDIATVNLGEREAPLDAGRPYHPAQAAPTRSTGSACIWLAGLLLLIVASFFLLIWGAVTSGFSGLAGMMPRVGLPLITPTTIMDVSRPSVISQIRPLGRIESVQYTLEKVISAESTGPLPIFTSDKILFVAHGEVIAGVDLAKMADGDVVVVSDTVTITLPAAEILVSRLDNEKSYVYNRETGIFTKADPNLESSVRRTAEDEIVKSALEDGILDKAQENAEGTLRTLILALGYEEVVFRTRSAPLYPTATP